MKILHLSSEKTWRGGEQQIAYLMQELVSKGIQPMVACRKGSEFESFAIKSGWTIFSLPFANSIDLVSAYRLKKICKDYQIDLVHIHSAKSHGVATLSCLLGCKTDLVLSRRVVFHPGRGFFTKWKYNHPKIKAIICISRAVQQQMSDFLINDSICKIVHSGIDINRLQQTKKGHFIADKYKISQDYILVGVTAALSEEKDLKTFINVAEKVVKTGVKAKFIIIGDGKLKAELVKLVEDKQLADQIIFTGFIYNVRPVLAELDIFLMTSKMEGLGTSILDAFCLKVPVVATNAGGIPELVINNQTGLLSAVGDATGLASNVLELINDKPKREHFAKEALIYVENFSKEAMSSKTFLIYKEILK